jgi:hypothetical protein
VIGFIKLKDRRGLYSPDKGLRRLIFKIAAKNIAIIRFIIGYGNKTGKVFISGKRIVTG